LALVALEAQEVQAALLVRIPHLLVAQLLLHLEAVLELLEQAAMAALAVVVLTAMLVEQEHRVKALRVVLVAQELFKALAVEAVLALLV
jgi:hypothetical protein